MTNPAPCCHPHTAARVAAAMLLGGATVHGAVAATATNLPLLTTTASLAQPGRIPPDERRFPTTSNCKIGKTTKKLWLFNV